MHLENYNEISVNLYFLESQRLHFWEHEKNLEKKDSTEIQPRFVFFPLVYQEHIGFPS